MPRLLATFQRPKKTIALASVLALSCGFTSVSMAHPGLNGSVLSILCQTRIAAAGGQDDHAKQLYFATDPMVQQRCIGCHLKGGIAPGAGAKLMLKPASAADYAAFNHEAFQTLVALRKPQYVLSKAVGSAHGGGSVLSAFSSEYQTLRTYLNALNSTSACDSQSATKESIDKEAAVWRDVGFSSKAETYRRAALVIGRTVPTQDQIDAVASGALSLDLALDEVMQGDGFHNFLITGANDQLLTDAFMNGLFPVNLHPEHWPKTAEAQAALLEELGEEQFGDENHQLWLAQNYGHARAPAELIAYIVENDFPYKEVLTADYEMMTPLTADIFDADLGWGESVVYNGKYSDFHMQFKPGINAGLTWSGGDDAETLCVVPTGACYPKYWEGVVRPHAGVLSTIAFLQRYPTTETNRNRARARWAYQLFLGVDIEASASRTTDAAALTDTNNPTLNNPACTVCHQTLDPAAGAFQNYDEMGTYRPDFDGDPLNPEHRDALPWAYKYSENSDWEPGDTWFADMRKPGFNGKTAPDSKTSLPWLAHKMANDPRFAVGTVEFWWPAVIGHDVLRAPEDPSLLNYATELMAYNLQRSEISRLALAFSRSGYSLKVLLKEFVQSKWFNAISMAQDHPYSDVLSIAGIGARRLLTPEELNAKTYSLLGFKVDYKISTYHLPLEESLLDRQRVALGGIDSYQVQSRSRYLSPLGAIVVDKHATSAACTVTDVDRLITDGNRLLLNGVDFQTPLSDTAALRDTLSNLYLQLHGEYQRPDSQQVDLLVELLVEAYELEHHFCHQNTEVRNQLIARARSQGLLVEDPDRYLTAIEAGNTMAWRLALDFMLSHYGYLYE